MFKQHLILSSLVIAAMALSNPASAAAIVNGNFDTDLSGWSTVIASPDNTTTPPTVGGSRQWLAGQAVLSTGSGGVAPFSAVLVQGDDGSFSFSNPILLGAGDDFFKFDAVFAALGADAMESGGGFTDNLQVKLYDAFDSTGSSDALIATIDATTVNSSFSFDLSSFIGRSVAFSFELNDENDGADSKVSLDNIRIAQRTPSGTVPEPGIFLLVIIGWLGLRGNRLRNNFKV